MRFELNSHYKPAGDQEQAIQELAQGVKDGEAHQILLGVTGSGKTFTIANVIAQVQQPVLLITHNKTLVTQLYGEFRQFFPSNAVACFVSYYDYYQPEAYIPHTQTYIEKDLNINEDLDKLRLQSITQILSGRRDVIIVASVSCIYGAGNPKEYENRIIRIAEGMPLTRAAFIRLLLDAHYTRTATKDLLRGQFRAVGDMIDIALPYLDYGYRVSLWGDKVESIHYLETDTMRTGERREHAAIFPSNIYVASKEDMPQILADIQDELAEQCAYFKRRGDADLAHRLQERVNYDIEMIRELGFCTGVENYSRFFDRREKGTRPYCLMDYFPEDFLCIIDESHQTIPQIRGMYEGDRKRKMNLVEYGFRLPSALDNRPLNFHEFESLARQRIYLSATPGSYELLKTEGVVVEQVVRPTGLLDPFIEVRPIKGQMDDLLGEIRSVLALGDRVLITTITKKMAEELHRYLQNLNIASMYIHSDIDTLERVEIIKALRLGTISVLIGVNLLREGLDMPEVSLVVILDADKEGFLRDERSLTQIIGRAARNSRGRAVLYADTITHSMRRTMEETERRRKKQIAYNKSRGIVPKTIRKTEEEILQQTAVLSIKDMGYCPDPRMLGRGADTDGRVKKKSGKTSAVHQENISEPALRMRIKQAAKNLDFIEAARLRDIWKQHFNGGSKEGKKQ